MSVENQDVPASETAQENVAESSNSGGVSDYIRQQLDYSFDISPEPATDAASAATTEATAPAEVQPPTEVPTTPAFDEGAFYSEFGVASKDELKARLDELNALKTTPQTPAEIAFANDESKRIHQLLVEGKLKEVKQYLDGQEMLSNYDSMNDEQRLKLYIKATNPLFDQELIEDEYQSQYRIDEDEFSGDDKALRREKVKLQQRLMNDVQKANEYFATYRQKIELPQSQPIQQPTPDADYEAYKASIAQAEEYHQKVIVPSINALKEGDFGVTVKINDQQNMMNFDVPLVVSKADLELAKSHAINFNDWMKKNFEDANGNINASRIAQVILRDMRFESYIQAAARQGAMAERQRIIEKETGTPRNEQREHVVQAEKSQLHKMLDEAYGGF